MRGTVGHGTSRNISYYRRHFSEIFLLFRKKRFDVLMSRMLEGPFLLGWSSQKVKKSAWDSGTWDKGSGRCSMNTGFNEQRTVENGKCLSMKNGHVKNGKYRDSSLIVHCPFSIVHC
jgi:hypothetical protein